MTGSELDDILADEPQVTETTQEETTTTTTQARDDHGRFTRTEAETVETPAAVTTSEAETGTTVPQQALHASREKEREARQEAETLRTQVAELRGQVDILSRQPQPAPKAEELKPKRDIWDDPDGFVQDALTPVQQALQQQAERFSMRMAIKEHGKDTVQSAYAALGAAMQAGDPSAKAEYQRIKGSDDPYEDIVQWHKRSQTLKTVGDDPNAWLEAELEKRLSDPAYQAKVLERIQATAAATTTRSDPLTKLPPSLTRLPAGTSAADGDMSDGALFSHAMR